MEESSAIRNRDYMYHIDFAGLGRPNAFGGLTHPGDTDLTYSGRWSDRWLFGEVKLEGSDFPSGQSYYQQMLANDITNKQVLYARMVFAPQHLVDGVVKAKNCKVIAFYYKPAQANTGTMYDVQGLGFTPDDLIAWADDHHTDNKIKTFLETKLSN